jgi:hypothetical protein
MSWKITPQKLNFLKKTHFSQFAPLQNNCSTMLNGCSHCLTRSSAMESGEASGSKGRQESRTGMRRSVNPRPPWAQCHPLPSPATALLMRQRCRSGSSTNRGLSVEKSSSSCREAQDARWRGQRRLSTAAQDECKTRCGGASGGYQWQCKMRAAAGNE